MTPVALTINGRVVQASVEPRLQLADFLRNELGLTGTHLGCEQGVCGACTVLIDGVPQRSCIAFAVDCDGSEIVTIEGFDGDPVMAELRETFSAHHGLQCGFCTPGMLVTAHDIVLRLGDVDEARIREELAGNLCRCTGYVGIVAAVRAVVGGRSATLTGRPAVADPRVAARWQALSREAVEVTTVRPALAETIAVHAAPPARSRPEVLWSMLKARLLRRFQ